MKIMQFEKSNLKQFLRKKDAAFPINVFSLGMPYGLMNLNMNRVILEKREC